MDGREDGRLAAVSFLLSLPPREGKKKNLGAASTVRGERQVGSVREPANLTHLCGEHFWAQRSVCGRRRRRGGRASACKYASVWVSRGRWKASCDFFPTETKVAWSIAVARRTCGAVDPSAFMKPQLPFVWILQVHVRTPVLQTAPTFTLSVDCTMPNLTVTKPNLVKEHSTAFATFAASVTLFVSIFDTSLSRQIKRMERAVQARVRGQIQ